ncbi:MAG TPA: hypothetical protein VHX38_07365, partial [Pseudonocardiaceae bacterium]|nr:hypothetical protein [Pseudonocardiaceae bacterium]
SRLTAPVRRDKAFIGWQQLRSVHSGLNPQSTKACAAVSPVAGGVWFAARRKIPAVGADPFRAVAVRAQIVALALRALRQSRSALGGSEFRL